MELTDTNRSRAWPIRSERAAEGWQRRPLKVYFHKVGSGRLQTLAKPMTWGKSKIFRMTTAELKQRKLYLKFGRSTVQYVVLKVCINTLWSGVWLSLARAPGLGPGGRRFESCHPDLTEYFQYINYARVAQGWSTTLPRWGPRVRIPSRALILKKISKKLLTNENSYDTISELLLKKLATTNLDNWRLNSM